MSRILVLYASRHGHTRKIARRMGRELRAHDLGVVVRSIRDADDEPLTGFSAIVIGASIHAGHHPREVVEWLRHHPITLSHMPSAFFSVSLSAASEDEAELARTQEWMDDLLDDTGWSPQIMQSFAGALQYRLYRLPLRILMMVKMARGHRPTDMTRDHDYTDWDRVDSFARDVAALVERAKESTLAQATGRAAPRTVGDCVG